ncbi:MAG: hypothetical protein HY681_11345 [Chloroflexi bacterium]|nr:hypothetical protein [Chloroflexota bacterium]
MLPSLPAIAFYLGSMAAFGVLLSARLKGRLSWQAKRDSLRSLVIALALLGFGLTPWLFEAYKARQYETRAQVTLTSFEEWWKKTSAEQGGSSNLAVTKLQRVPDAWVVEYQVDGTLHLALNLAGNWLTIGQGEPTGPGG